MSNLIVYYSRKGQSYLNMLSTEQVVIGDVTLEPVTDEEYGKSEG